MFVYVDHFCEIGIGKDPLDRTHTHTHKNPKKGKLKKLNLKMRF